MKKNNLPKDLKARTTAGVIRHLEKKGCCIEGGGKHLKATHPNRTGAIIIPNGRKELPTGTFHSIIKAIIRWGLLALVLIYIIF